MKAKKNGEQGEEHLDKSEITITEEKKGKEHREARTERKMFDLNYKPCV
jgi:hypothetical protein